MSDLQFLLDEAAIKQGLARFARIIDGRGWHELPEVFAADVSFDYGSGGDQRGLAALQGVMAGFLDRCGGTQHLIGSVLVKIDGDRATSRAYVQARHQRISDRGGPVFDSNGEYVDRWERRPDGWRIVRRDVAWMTHSGDPAILSIGTDGLA